LRQKREILAIGVAFDCQEVSLVPTNERDGGGNGSIIGRNTFQRPRADALEMLDNIIKIYQGKY